MRNGHLVALQILALLTQQKSITVGSDENETIIDRPLKAEEIQSILSKPCDDIILDIFTKRYRKCSTKKYRSSSVFDPFVVTGSLLLEFWWVNLVILRSKTVNLMKWIYHHWNQNGWFPYKLTLISEILILVLETFLSQSLYIWNNFYNNVPVWRSG